LKTNDFQDFIINDLTPQACLNETLKSTCISPFWTI
jgi:hypothetical protein